jgi:hypothetical protein
LSKFKTILLLLVATAVVAAALVNRIGLNSRALRYAQEYGPIETAQLFMVVVCVGLFAYSYKYGSGAVRVGGGALGLLSLAAFARELDVKKFNGPDWYQWIANRGLQEILFVSVLAVMFFYLWRQRSWWRDVLSLLLRWRSFPLFLAGGLITVSQILDGSTLYGRDPMFWEETAELLGYSFLALAAVRHRQLVE